MKKLLIGLALFASASVIGQINLATRPYQDTNIKVLRQIRLAVVNSSVTTGTVVISGTVSANIVNQPSVTVLNPSVTVLNPSVTISGTANVNVANSPSVTVLNPSVTVLNPSVTVLNPSVTISGTANVNVTNTVSVTGTLSTSPTNVTLTSGPSSVTTSGTVTAGAASILFETSNNFAGTIDGLTFGKSGFLSYPISPGSKYPAIPYTVTNGTLFIRKMN